MLISWTGPGNPYLKNAAGLMSLVFEALTSVPLPLLGAPTGNPAGIPAGAGADGAGVEVDDDDPQKKRAALDSPSAGTVNDCFNIDIG